MPGNPWAVLLIEDPFPSLCGLWLAEIFFFLIRCPQENSHKLIKIPSIILLVGSNALGQAHGVVILSENVWRFE